MNKNLSAGTFEEFVVALPVFSGSLAELASALRTGAVLPTEVPLLDLTRRVLARVADWRTLQPEAVAEVLPPLASVIALKARLLLPRLEAPTELVDEGDDFLEDVVGGVEALAELDVLVTFLSARRREREGLIPAPPMDLGLPRRERRTTGTQGLARLVKAARSAVREVSVPLFARERLTLAGALGALRAFASHLPSFLFSAVPAQDWGDRTTYFSALLEGVKTGDFEVRQEVAYGPIEVRPRSGSIAPDSPAHEA
ncbi:segregation and condensation protein A [Deinococcus peraridilitoris]|uniref:segregation and condensation protein A n=1 Tax=Deinococcus peraridilitoris TaxID=432329 RepID=UPI0002D9ED81|nr:ScpA family protein [Deinococcus peraridilitoris]